MKLMGLTVLLCILCGLKEARAQLERDENLPPATLPLQLTLTTNKTVYLTGEPIVLDVQVRNPEHKEGYFLSVGGDLFLQVFDAQGQHVVFNSADTGSAAYGKVSFGLAMKSSDEYVATSLDLMYGDVAMVSSYFKAAAPVVRVGRMEGQVRAYALVPGKYTIKAVQRTYEDKAHRYLKSTPVAFEVKEPNEAETPAFEWFKVRPVPFYEFWRNGEWDMLYPEIKRSAFANWIKTRATYRKLYNTYPSSPYAPYALYDCGRLSQEMGEWQNATAFYEQLLRENPNFPLRADLLYFLANCHLQLNQTAKAREDFQLLQEPNVTRLVTPTITYYEHPTRMEKLEQDIKNN